ncbi:hypothetical protein RN001_005731 [Aquatica leii]|uniref:Uncharacterized protein n=1 Tax=Aquatica leii TaxID=1421715 RepID=A0AAN7Q1P1_9COLE|nr:hypothetical protein RN001_005731 [Aquatica leii]
MIKHSAISHFNIINLIHVAVRNNYNSSTATLANIQNVIKTWFRNAPDREGGRAKRQSKKEKEEANRRGIELFQHLQVLPDRHTPKICPVCEVEMGTSSDRTRMLGWRYRCLIPPHHKREATVNTFLERVRLREVP